MKTYNSFNELAKANMTAEPSPLSLFNSEGRRVTTDNLTGMELLAAYVTVKGVFNAALFARDIWHKMQPAIRHPESGKVNAMVSAVIDPIEDTITHPAKRQEILTDVAKYLGSYIAKDIADIPLPGIEMFLNALPESLKKHAIQGITAAGGKIIQAIHS